jgi:hypothetical protein
MSRRAGGFVVVVGIAGAAYVIWQRGQAKPQDDFQPAAMRTDAAQNAKNQLAAMDFENRSNVPSGLTNIAADFIGENAMDLFGGRGSTSTTPRAENSPLGWLDAIFGGFGSGGGTSTPDTRATGGAGVGSLLDLIGRHESGGDYNRVWGGIRREDYPAQALTSMTVGQVLAWQDSIDHKYNSEAAGKYQIMEDTLRDLVRGNKVSVLAKFDSATQDEIAVLLMERRGLGAYRAGRISGAEFGQRLSMEWARFPARDAPRQAKVTITGMV